MEEDGKRNDLARMRGIARVLGLGRAGPPGAPIPENVSDAALGPRRGGCAPGRGATGWGRKTTQAPHHGGLPACKDKRMLCLLTAPAEFSKRITLHHTFPLPRKPRSALASPKRAVKKKARPKVERPREPVVQDRPTDKETAKHPRAKQTPEQRQEYERARNQTPERREYNRRYAQEQRQQAKQLGKCRDCGKPAIPNQTRCPTCTEAHRQSRRRSDAKRSAAAKGKPPVEE